MQSSSVVTTPRNARYALTVTLAVLASLVLGFASSASNASASTLVIPLLETHEPKLLPLISDVQAIQHLSEQREANGIPGGLTLEPSLSEGCLSWATIYREAPGQYPHEEIPTQPGYTPEGNAAVASSDLAGEPGNKYTVGRLWTTQFNPWSAAAFHTESLMNPAATEAWYGATNSAACMGTGGSRAFTTPAFYSYPGNGATEVPTRENTAEWPHSPEQDVGLGDEAFVAGAIILWAEGTQATLASATLQSSRGAVVPTKLETTDYYNDGASFVVPTTKLQPDTAYTLTANWSTATGEQTQTVHFTSGPTDLSEAIERLEEAGPRHELGRVTLNLHGHYLTITTAGIATSGDRPLTLRLIRCENGECGRSLGVAWKKTIVLRHHLAVTLPRVAKGIEYRLEVTMDAFRIADTMPVPAGG